MTAVDPEDGALAYSIHWGDEDDIGSTMDLPGGVGMHRYASAPDDMPYQGLWT